MALQYGRSRLPELLATRRISQAEFARRLDVSEGYVSQIIKGSTRFSFLMAIRASIILRCTPNDLYEWINE
jgi:transcriptional regulator with XRE-family HTH domain